jgi:putative transcription factor
MDKTHAIDFQQTFDHQDWKQVIIKKPQTTTEFRKENNISKPSSTNKKLKSIEKKAEEGDLKHRKITKELKLQIQQARNSKGLTQKQLAQQCQLTPQIINDIESGKSIYNHSHISKIKRILKIK